MAGTATHGAASLLLALLTVSALWVHALASTPTHTLKEDARSIRFKVREGWCSRVQMGGDDDGWAVMYAGGTIGNPDLAVS